MPSSTWPSQLLSMPSHFSGVASALGAHTIAPFVHLYVPGAQMPGRLVVHVPPPSGLFSSVMPSQSLSRPSHFSGEEGTTEKQSTVYWPARRPHVILPCEQTPGAP